jgi:heat-inducible transcriptional repressor
VLSPRQQKILENIIGQYINRAKPVPSQSIINDPELGISSATVRNEMARLEEEGYILRPHTSSGSVPTDKGYRLYVENIGETALSIAEQEKLDQLFGGMEGEIDEWLNLAASLMAGMVRNTAVVSAPRSSSCHFKHVELVSVQDLLLLIVLVLNGARVRQQILTLDEAVTQESLTVTATKLSALYAGLTAQEIGALSVKLTPLQRKISDCVVKIIETEDEEENGEPYLDGLHFLFSQPEFQNDRRLALSLMELIEGGSLMRNIVPPQFSGQKVQVIIGRENRARSIQDYSVILGRYGTPGQASGTIGIIGPTRMPYARAIGTVGYLTLVLSRMVDELYPGHPQVEKVRKTNLDL